MYSKEQQLERRRLARKHASTQKKKLIKRLDAIVTKIVVLRDKKCVTCGRTTEVYCGHFHSRTHHNTRWDLMNCHAQCNPCNGKHEHDTYPYTRFMAAKYSMDELDALYQRHCQTSHFKDADLVQLLAELEREYESLKTQFNG